MTTSANKVNKVNKVHAGYQVDVVAQAARREIAKAVIAAQKAAK